MRLDVIYTVVDEGYDVSVFRSAKAAAAWVAGNGLCLDNDSEAPVEASEADIIRALRKDGLVRLFPVDGGDWRYRMEKHNKVLA
jgi:hypothetical protein